MGQHVIEVSGFTPTARVPGGLLKHLPADPRGDDAVPSSGVAHRATLDGFGEAAGHDATVLPVEALDLRAAPGQLGAKISMGSRRTSA